MFFNNFIYCVKLVYCLHQCLNLHNPPIRKFLEAKKNNDHLMNIHASFYIHSNVSIHAAVDFYIHSHVSIHAAVDISTTKLRRTQSKFFIKPKMGDFLHHQEVYTCKMYETGSGFPTRFLRIAWLIWLVHLIRLYMNCLVIMF